MSCWITYLCVFLLYNKANSAVPQEQLYFDPMDSTTASTWTYGGNVVIPTSTGCHVTDAECFQLSDDAGSGLGDGYIEKTFDVSGYYNITFGINFKATNDTGKLYVYSFNNGVKDTVWSMYLGLNFLCCNDIRLGSLDPSPNTLWDDRSVLKIQLKLSDATGTVALSDWSIDGYTITPQPTTAPTKMPSLMPSITPTNNPSESPTQDTNNPSQNPSSSPSKSPSDSPSKQPSMYPSNSPTQYTGHPTSTPSKIPSKSPSKIPSNSPSKLPSNSPSEIPSSSPSNSPTESDVSDPGGVSMTSVMVSIILIVAMQLFAL